MISSDTKITDIRKLYRNGPYVVVFNNEQVGDLFMYNNGSFYDKDGEGPWKRHYVKEFQQNITDINNKAGEIVCYITPFIDKKYQYLLDTFLG